MIETGREKQARPNPLIRFGAINHICLVKSFGETCHFVVAGRSEFRLNVRVLFLQRAVNGVTGRLKSRPGAASTTQRTLKTH